MIRIEQPIEVAATMPAHIERSRSIESLEDSANRRHRVSVDLTMLDPRDRGLADPGSRCQIGLPPSPALAKHDDDPSDARVIHRATIPQWLLPPAYRALTSRTGRQPATLVDA